MVQTFFRGNHCKYFVVTPLPVQGGEDKVTPSTIDHLVDIMLEQAEKRDTEEDMQLRIVDANQYMVDKSPWMR